MDLLKSIKAPLSRASLLAQGDIGGNVITATNITYQLDTISSFGVSGTALFEKRVNGNTLVTISLSGTISGDTYPATINLGSISSVGGGPVVKTLIPVDGATGKSYTNIRKLDSDVPITYDNWLVYDGYINIYQTSIGLNNIICHGNIGSNRHQNMKDNNGLPLIGVGEARLGFVPKMMNRHGLITGATGTGKTISLQVMAEAFSSMGVPVFLSDVKGDLSGISLPGGTAPKVVENITKLNLTDYSAQGFPVCFWDIFGEQGHPLRTTISEMGPLLLKPAAESERYPIRSPQPGLQGGR